MNKKILIIFIVFLLTGCWNYKELNSLAISTAMAIDKVDDEYEVSILIANSKKSQVSSKEGESQTIVYSGKGKSLSKALKEIDLKNPRQTYIGHLSVIIVSEDVAKEGMLGMLDLLLRNSESNKRFYLAVAKDVKAKDIVSILSPLETFPAQNIATNISFSKESQAVSTAIIYSKFIENLIKKGINPILSSITIEGDIKDGKKDDSLQKSQPDAIVKTSQIAIFKKDKFLTFASNEESRGINLINNEITEMILEVEDGCTTIVKASEMNTKFNINSDLSVDIIVDGRGNIIENNCDIDLQKSDNIKKIEKLTNKQIKKLIQKGIKLTKKYKTDIFGFGNSLYKKDPKKFNRIKNWDDDYFPDLKINIKSNIVLTNKGAAKQTIKEAIDEN